MLPKSPKAILNRHKSPALRYGDLRSQNRPFLGKFRNQSYVLKTKVKDILKFNPFSANKAELTQFSTVGAYKRHASTYELGRKK